MGGGKVGPARRCGSGARIERTSVVAAVIKDDKAVEVAEGFLAPPTVELMLAARLTCEL